MAWIFATCPESRFRDGAKALKLAQKALAVESTPYRLDTLAAAYAESGRFTKAVAIQEEVIDRLRRSGDPALVAECLERLNAYRSRTPWREK
jgi:hypothetical protein